MLNTKGARPKKLPVEPQTTPREDMEPPQDRGQDIKARVSWQLATESLGPPRSKKKDLIPLRTLSVTG